MADAQYGVSWGVPQGWYDISDQVVPPTASTLYWRAWSDRPEAAAIFSEPLPGFPDGLMLLTLHVEPEGAAPFPPPDSMPQETLWGQRRVVQAYELTGVDAAPFALQVGFAVVRSPYRYNLELNCLPAQSQDAAQMDAVCRKVWRSLTFPFGLCAIPFAPTPEPVSWRSVTDHYYNYSIEVPSGWLFQPGATGDRATFISDPEAYDAYHACPLPNGVMGIGFMAGTAQDFSARQEGGGPDLEGFTETTVNGYPVWIRKVRGGDAAAPDSPPEFLYIAAFIRGPQYWYLLPLRCWPPTGADADGQAAYHAQCETTFYQILERFQAS
jgi:hypothetical protein